MPIDDKVPDEDLEKVKCDNWNCDKIGEYGRCYMHIYVNCPIYKEWKKTYTPEPKTI